MSEFYVGKYFFPFVIFQNHTTNQKTTCGGYMFYKTNMTSASRKFQPVSNGDADCSFYHNADNGEQLLTTCSENCLNKPDTLFDVYQLFRSIKTKMCMQPDAFKDCTSGQVDGNGVCMPKSCTDTCMNGLCDVEGSCTCVSGYSLDLKTRVCVLNECLDACVGGTCAGPDEIECVCDDGFKKKPDVKFECDKIDCPDAEFTGFCHQECMMSSCKASNGQCQEGECKCNYGYKKSANNKYQCVTISCPSSVKSERRHCESKCLQRCLNGRCSDDGSCDCKQGFEKVLPDLFKCDEIVCPSETGRNHEYCFSTCKNNCVNGVCSENGACQCQEGFVRNNLASNVSCHHECNVDGSCNEWYRWVIAGGGLSTGVLIVAIVAVVAVFIRKKIREEQLKKDNGRFNLSDIGEILRTAAQNRGMDRTPSPRRDATYLEPRQINRQLGEDEYFEMAPTSPLSSRLHLGYGSSGNASVDHPIYDTPYDHFEAGGRLVRPTPPDHATLYVNHGQAINAQGQIQAALRVNHPPDIREIRQQRNRLKAIESSRTWR